MEICQQWSTSTTRSYTVRHNLTRRSAGASTVLNVAIARQNLIGSTIVSSRNFSGTSNGTFTSSLTSGTYFLQFESNERTKTFDINGSVTY
ncbi:T9SS type A sorting domain-containing protein [Enterococcus faecium]|nr:T9SS type A sorting domain-containing protein [Enterococcus faecium]